MEESPFHKPMYNYQPKGISTDLVSTDNVLQLISPMAALMY